MVREHFGAITVGLGAMGSATVYQLAKRGQPVLGIDQFAPPHPYGSTHGETRVTRQAIGEGVYYSPFAIRSHELWREIEREAGCQLLTLTGLLVISSESSVATMHVPDFLVTTIAAAKTHHIPHELLSAAEIRMRFPAFNVRDEETGYFEPGAGFVRPEACVAAQLTLAERYGAVLHRRERVLAIDQDGKNVVVQSDAGTYVAERVILTAGPWLPELLAPELAGVFSVTRQVLYWFAPRKSVTPFLPERFPVFIWEPVGAREAVYGFPAIDGPDSGIKVAASTYGQRTTATRGSRPATAEEVTAMYETLVAPCFPGVSSRCLKTVTCLYTVTPDGGFVIDRHPEVPQIFLVSPCSGHGFKHSAAIGEAVAELVTDGASRLDVSHFRLDRFRTWS
jgi:sarcosine oxidase